MRHSNRIYSLILILIFVLLRFGSTARAEPSPLVPDWSQSANIDPYGRANPYGWDAKTLAEKIRLGNISALNYPVTSTGVLIPARITYKFLDAQKGDPLFGLLKTVLSLSGDFKNFKGFWEWLGLHDYPDTDKDIPYPNGVKPDYPMGASFIKRGNTMGLTFSCAVCHSASLFGRPILGMTNRFSNANMAFIAGQKLFHTVGPNTLGVMTRATREEVEMYKISRENVSSIGTKRPAVLGLDTALAQVARSIARRAPTEWAERDHTVENHPRSTEIDEKIADSKPAVWWNTKYKTRWLSDGGIISGSPVITNLVWNELGRGGDLRELDRWIRENEDVVQNLTTAVFATRAPKWSDYVGPNVQIARARAGEVIFNHGCASCHGNYEKAWSLTPEEFARLKSADPTLDQIDTVRVKYFSHTKVADVGTDAGRRIGMQAMADALNPLAISKQYGMVNQTQKGYVPPPLEGIFARYPYLHNNSIPNLCVLMMPPEQRPMIYYSGKTIDKNLDYDQNCVGYPIGNKTPDAWKKDSQYLFDTRVDGLTNIGHYERIFRNEDGTERYTRTEKAELIEFLKTL
jgi:mono/diheme cytochrome c family protein